MNARIHYVNGQEMMQQKLREQESFVQQCHKENLSGKEAMDRARFIRFNRKKLPRFPEPKF